MRKIKEVKMKQLFTVEELIEAIKEYNKSRGALLFFDTETTGLNIKYDTPFLLPFGYMYKDTAYIYCVDIENEETFYQAALSLIALARKGKGLCGHNIKYDLHMLNNIKIDTPDNIHYIDTMILIRLAHDALTPENGGPPLGLKEYATKYIDRSAKDHEHLIKAERMQIAKDYNKKLKDALYKIDRKWTIRYLDEYFKDVLHSVDTLDDNVKEAYRNWYKTIPEDIRKNMTLGRVESDDIPYTYTNRKRTIEYAMYDIVWTMEIYLQCIEAIKARDNMEALRREECMIMPLVRMESCGFQIDEKYVREVTVTLADYLRQQREALYKLVGKIGVGQHAEIKKILITKYNLSVPGTGKEDLNRIYDELKVKEPDSEVVRFIGLVQELRTLEKWYSTYLLRFIRELDQGHKRIYTQINQVGTVSGRVTSDFQQFPKYGINKEDGTPLFHPRRMIIKSPEYKGIAYLDYSQVELRLQALYTILVGSPDLNLCRAYMPYECVRIVEDDIGCDLSQSYFEPFDYKNPEHIAHAYDWKWYLKEDTTKEWVPTDVHAATTHVAFPDLDIHSDEFKKLRGKIGKRVNFAKNYGAQFNRIKVMFPDYDDETIHRIDNAYYGAFPGVKKYHEYCYEIAKEKAYVVNLFGVKYYGLSGHKAINTLVQGSGAYLLKERIKEVDAYIQKNHLKTRMQMQIHDELSYEVYPGEEEHVLEFKKIMQKFEGTYVPIIADLEFTTTSWADKEECDYIE